MVFVNEIIMLQVIITDCNLKIQVNKWRKNSRISL